MKDFSGIPHSYCVLARIILGIFGFSGSLVHELSAQPQLFVQISAAVWQFNPVNQARAMEILALGMVAPLVPETTISSWFMRLPSHHRGDLCGRFRCYPEPPLSAGYSPQARFWRR
jgi:hypothetical protein